MEIFCDHDSDLTLKNTEGMTPLMYSAKKGFDKICMYLTLRSPNVDEEDDDGKNVFFIYLEKQDLPRCKQLLKRGSNINFRNKDHKTTLHLAIEKKLPEKIIRFLIDFGANPHIEDFDKKDACELAGNLYPEISELQGVCLSPELRVPYVDKETLKNLRLGI